MCRDNDASNPPVSLTAEIKARLHAAYDILPGIFLFRADGTEELVFANQDALALYQCKSFRELREKIGTHFSHFLQPDDYLPLSELAGCSTAKDTPHRFYSYEYRTALGHLRRVEVTLQQGTDADLGPLYYMSLIDADTRRNAYETDTLRSARHARVLPRCRRTCEAEPTERHVPAGGSRLFQHHEFPQTEH